MKKWIILVEIIAVLFMPLVAQADGRESWTEKLSIGGQTGLTLARFAGPRANDEFVSSFYEFGATIGLAMEFRVTDIASAQTDITFTLKRSRSTVDGMDFGTYHMKYLEVPLLARISLPITGRVKYYGALGPSLAILLDADAYLADGRHLDFDRGFKRTDIGLMLGAGAAVRVGETHAIHFDIRYNHGLRDIDDTVADDELMKRAIYFTVGYRANLDDLLHGFRRKAPPPVRKMPPAPEPDAAPGDTAMPEHTARPTACTSSGTSVIAAWRARARSRFGPCASSMR